MAGRTGRYLAEVDKVIGEDFGAFGDAVLAETLSEVAEKILRSRNRSGLQTSNKYSLNISGDIRKALLDGEALHIDEYSLAVPRF